MPRKKKNEEDHVNLGDVFTPDDVALWRGIEKPEADWEWAQDVKTGRWKKVKPEEPTQR